MRTIERAQKEWLEQEEVEKSKGRKSTEETAYMHEQQSQGNEVEGTIIMDVAIAKQNGQNTLSIGVTVWTTPNTRIAEWVLREGRLRNKVLDEAVALKLVL